MAFQFLETLGVSLALAAMISAASARLRLLTAGGAVAATIVGTAAFACGGRQGGAALLAFFISANLLGRWRRRFKQGLGFEKGGQRDVWQVLANGGVAAAAIALSTALPHYRIAFVAAYLAALAEASADTWATEIGSACGATPRLITTGKPTLAGRSGAVSLPGTLAAGAGSALIALLLPLFGPSNPHLLAVRIAAIAACGFAGSLLDSLLGATLQAQYSLGSREPSALTERLTEGARLAHGYAAFGNDLVNALSGLASALAAFLLTNLV